MTDDYPTCEETYVTLRIYHDSAEPTAVSSALQLEPTESQMVGDSYEQRGVHRICPLSGWFFSSEDRIESYDTAKHLDWLLQQLQPNRLALETLRSQGWRMDIACLWDSHSGHGGPTLSAELLRRLGDLGIDLWFDVYFHGAYHGIEHSKMVNATPPMPKR